MSKEGFTGGTLTYESTNCSGQGYLSPVNDPNGSGLLTPVAVIGRTAYYAEGPTATFLTGSFLSTDAGCFPPPLSPFTFTGLPAVGVDVSQFVPPFRAVQ